MFWEPERIKRNKAEKNSIEKGWMNLEFPNRYFISN